MSRIEKDNYISLFTTLITTIPYLVYTFIKYNSENLNSDEELKYWVTAILILIPIRIVSEIIVTIIVAIFQAAIKQEDHSDLVDERDKLIELKSLRNSHWVFVIGTVTSLISFLAYESAWVIFGGILIAGFVSEIMDIVSKIYYYHKGV